MDVDTIVDGLLLCLQAVFALVAVFGVLMSFEAKTGYLGGEKAFTVYWLLPISTEEGRLLGVLVMGVAGGIAVWISNRRYVERRS